MFIAARLISLAVLLVFGLTVANAEMIVRTKDGRTFTVQVESGEVESITFTGSGTTTGTTPQTQITASTLGSVWRTREVSGTTVYEAVWTRRGTSNVFDGVWQSAGVKASLTLESVNGNRVVFYRPGSGRYAGTLSSDGRRITSGTMDWASGFQWTATIE